MFNGLTLGLSSEARGLAMHCGLLHGHNIYSLGLMVVTGELTVEKLQVIIFQSPLKTNEGSDAQVVKLRRLKLLN